MAMSKLVAAYIAMGMGMVELKVMNKSVVAHSFMDKVVVD